MRLTPAQAGQLAHLAKGGSLPRSRVAKVLLSLLESERVVHMERSGSSYLVRGIPEKIEIFAEQRFGIRDLHAFALSDPDNRSRASMAELAGDSKALPNHPLAGILLRCFGRGTLRDGPPIHTPPGSALLVVRGELPHLRITARTLIAIENVECLLKFEQAVAHLRDIALADTALVLRWNWGAAWREWLRAWPGTLLHFPDYDRAGLRIFATELLPQRSDARLLLPEHFESLLVARGSRKLFLRHEHLTLLQPDHPDIARVSAVIESARKALEQESLLY